MDTSYLVRNMVDIVNRMSLYIPEHLRSQVLQEIDDFLQENFYQDGNVNSIEYQKAKLDNIVEHLCINLYVNQNG